MPDLSPIIEDVLALRTSGWLLPLGWLATLLLLAVVVSILKYLEAVDEKRLRALAYQKSAVRRRSARNAVAIPQRTTGRGTAPSGPPPVPARMMRPQSWGEPLPRLVQAQRPGPLRPEGIDPAQRRPVAESEASLMSLAVARAAARRPIGSAEAADDLKRIRCIGTMIERKLNDMGITRYQQMAEWDARDLHRINGALGLPGRIEREGWIEQAKILASGGSTGYARRIDEGARYIPDRRRVLAVPPM